MRSPFADLHTLLRIPYFPLVDSRRIYKQFGMSKAIRWFFIRLLVPFGISQPKPGRGSGTIAELREFGYADLPARSATQVTELADLFLARQRLADSQDYCSLADYFGYWRSQRTLGPPGLMATGEDCPLTRLSRDPSIIAIVCEYLGLPSHRIRVQASIEALIRVEGKATLIGGYDAAVEFHRDIDSWKWVKVFVYLTDTAEGDGQHEMFRKSHLKTPLALVPIRRYERAEILAAMPGLELRKICGPAGFTFIENTFTFHRGTKPTRNDRLIAILTYNDESVSPWMLAKETYPLAG
ncbi:MAG: hypothetical protein ABSD02_06280 [Steroidobacteraceae bacterium]|jgi:hypothetical protein